MIRYSKSWVHNFQTSQSLRFLNLAPPVKRHFRKIEEVLNGYARLQSWALFDEISGAENLETPGAGAQIGRRAHLGARVGAAVTRAVDVLQAVCMITIIDKLQDSNVTQSLAYNIDCKNFARCEYIMRFILSLHDVSRINPLIKR